MVEGWICSTKPSGTSARPPFLRVVLTFPPFVKEGRENFISISFHQNIRQLKALTSLAACIPCSVPVKELKLLAPPRKSLLYLCFPLFSLLCFIFFITFLWTIYKCFRDDSGSSAGACSRIVFYLLFYVLNYFYVSASAFVNTFIVIPFSYAPFLL